MSKTARWRVRHPRTREERDGANPGQIKHAGAYGWDYELTAEGHGRDASLRRTGASGPVIIATESTSLLKDGYATSDGAVRNDKVGFNFEGITNGQAVGPSPTRVYVHVCPVKGMEKPCYSTASARSIYDSTPHSTIDTSYVDVKARSEIDEPSEFDLAVMMAARTGACRGTAATTSMSLRTTTMDKYLLSTAQWRPSSWCSESRGGIEAYIAGLILTDLIPTAATRGSRGPGGAGGGRGDG